MGRIITLASLAVGLVALMPADVGAQKKKKQEIADIATDQDYKTLQSIKDMTGKIGSVNTNSITFRLDIPRLDPNPKYKPPTRVEQVLTGMQGYLLIDANSRRIANVDGTLFKDVGFGWGILGHLDKGGRFEVNQGEVGEDAYEITRMRLDFTGKLLLFKGIVIKFTETYSHFQRVPPDLTFARAVDLLKRQEIPVGSDISQPNRVY